MTDDAGTTMSSAQLDRIARLRDRRGQSTPLPDPAHETLSPVAESVLNAPPERKPRRKRHVAQTGRVVAAGLGATTMFGIVGVLGFNHPLSATNDPGVDSATSPVAVAAPPPIQVVVHRIPAASPITEATTSSTAEPSFAPAPPAPIVLTANPVVKTVTVAAPAPASGPAPAPSATTSGSN